MLLIVCTHEMNYLTHCLFYKSNSFKINKQFIEVTAIFSSATVHMFIVIWYFKTRKQTGVFYYNFIQDGNNNSF